MTPGQLTFDSYRATDPETSRLASVDTPTKANNRQKAYEALQRLGEGTRSEIAREAGLADDSTTSRRLSDLEELGLIVKTGETRRGASGAAQSVWRMK